MNLNADTLNEFATIATVVSFSLLSSQRVKLTQQFNNPDYLYIKGGFEKLVKWVLLDWFRVNDDRTI